MAESIPDGHVLFTGASVQLPMVGMAIAAADRGASCCRPSPPAHVLIMGPTLANRTAHPPSALLRCAPGRYLRAAPGRLLHERGAWVGSAFPPRIRTDREAAHRAAPELTILPLTLLRLLGVALAAYTALTSSLEDLIDMCEVQGSYLARTVTRQHHGWSAAKLEHEGPRAECFAWDGASCPGTTVRS